MIKQKRIKAELANIGKLFSFGHKHLKQLCKNSEFLKGLNSDWITLKLPDKIECVNVYGDQDQIVDKPDVAECGDPDKLKVIQGADHRTVVKPKSDKDIAFAIFKRTLFSC